MNVSYGTGSGITLIDSGTHQGDYINVSSSSDGLLTGFLKYFGSGNVTDDTFTVPVYVSNGGSFRLQSSVGQPNGGKLTVKDQSNYVFPDGSKHSVYVVGAVHLQQGAYLKCVDSYYQANGTLDTDNSPCTLDGGALGGNPRIVTIAGGNVTIDNVPGTYNTLYVFANLQFKGELDVSMNANTPGQSDNLSNQWGTTNLQAGATLSVKVDNGPPNPMQTWTIINDALAPKTITGDFVQPITTNPDTKLTGQVEPINKLTYILTS